jgi:hypothetical protein
MSFFDFSNFNFNWFFNSSDQNTIIIQVLKVLALIVFLLILKNPKPAFSTFFNFATKFLKAIFKLISQLFKLVFSPLSTFFNKFYHPPVHSFNSTPTNQNWEHKEQEFETRIMHLEQKLEGLSQQGQNLESLILEGLKNVPSFFNSKKSKPRPKRYKPLKPKTRKAIKSKAEQTRKTKSKTRK